MTLRDELDTAHVLQPEQLERFGRDGYIISPQLLSPASIDEIRRAHERIWAGDFDGDGHTWIKGAVSSHGYEPHRLRKVDNGWWINDVIRDVVTSEMLGSIARQLLGVPAIRLWHDQVIYKPPSGGDDAVGNVGWHQDAAHWQASDTQRMVTAWIALQDTDLDNGGMRSIAGSAAWGLVRDANTFGETNLDDLRSRYEQFGEWRDEPCVLEAGTASFHHALCFHGSGPNRSSEPRLSVIAHMMPDGTAYAGNRQRHENIGLLGPRPRVGQRFEGPYFPIVGRVMTS